VVDTYETIGRLLAGDATLRRARRRDPRLPALGGRLRRPVHRQHHGHGGEALGLAPIGSSTMPAVYSERACRCCAAPASRVMQMLAHGRPRCRATSSRAERWRTPAAAGLAATGGSTNAALHIPAIAHEAGIRFHLDDVAAVFARTPLIADLKPGGKYLARDVYVIGGAGVILRALLASKGHLHGDASRFTGRTLAQELAGLRGPTAAWCAAAWKSRCSRDGGLVVLKGNLCPDGALLKTAGLKTLVHRRPGARLRDRGGAAGGGAGPRLPAGDVLVIRNEGPQGRPRHARDAGHHGVALRPGHGRPGGAADRRPLLRRHARLCIGYAGPEAADGGPIAALRDGDRSASTRGPRRAASPWS
jgi:dihydroxy-acid dehydratase